MQFTQQQIDQLVTAYLDNPSLVDAVKTFNESIANALSLEAQVVQAIWDIGVEYCPRMTLYDRLNHLNANDIFGCVKDLEARGLLALTPAGIKLL